MSKKLKKLVITGSEGFIGRKLCQHFDKRFQVVKLDLALGHNLTNEDFVAEWFNKNKGLYGMIVCHAFNPTAPLVGARSKKIEPHDMPLKELRDYFEVNSISAFDVCRNFVKNNKGGVIINTSSFYGMVVPRHDMYDNFVKPIGYSMSKAALNIMSKYLATYYAPNFRFNTVVLAGVSFGNENTKFVAKYGKNSPLGRLMRIDEVISAFDFLVDERSSYVTGAEIIVDGGWTAW